MGNKQDLITAVRDALYCSKICAYAQGFQLMREAQNEYKWKLDFRDDREHLARRVHHPRPLSSENQPMRIRATPIW